MDLLNHRVGGVVFYQVFLISPSQYTVTLYRNGERLREFKKLRSKGKTVKVTVNSKEENSEDFCLDFFREFGLWIYCTTKTQSPFSHRFSSVFSVQLDLQYIHS
jgi:hypothetical protein